MKAEGVIRGKSRSAHLRAPLRDYRPPPCEHCTEVCAAQLPAAWLLLCTLCPVAADEDGFPLTQSWKSSAGFPNTKAMAPQTTSRVLLDGESLISPGGGFL